MSAVVVLILRILIAVLLYAFAGYAFFLLWKTMRKSTDTHPGSGIPSLGLLPLEGSDMEARYFDVEEVLVGREKGCQLCLTDDTVSARHAKLSYHNKQWWVEDLGSTNGTYINKMPVTTPTVLVKADMLAFGKVGLVVELD